MNNILEWIKGVFKKMPKWCKIVVTVLALVVFGFFIMFGFGSCEGVKIKTGGCEVEVSTATVDLMEELNDRLVDIYSKYEISSLWDIPYDTMDSIVSDEFGMTYSACLDYLDKHDLCYDGVSVVSVGDLVE